MALGQSKDSRSAGDRMDHPAVRPFNMGRRVPRNVLILDAEQPLVRLGGNGLRELREDVFDAAFNANCRAGASGVDTYATAMSGGEPYAVWA